MLCLQVRTPRAVMEAVDLQERQLQAGNEGKCKCRDRTNHAHSATMSLGASLQVVVCVWYFTYEGVFPASGDGTIDINRSRP